MNYGNVTPQRPKPRRAYFLTDTIFGLIILGTVTVALAATVRHERAAESSLTESRSALHLAEHALLNLQHGRPLPSVGGQTHLAIHPATGGVAPSGFIWAIADATVHGHHRSLVGIVPAGSIRASGGK